jgi:hypothetical protein
MDFKRIKITMNEKELSNEQNHAVLTALTHLWWDIHSRKADNIMHEYIVSVLVKSLTEMFELLEVEIPTRREK